LFCILFQKEIELLSLISLFAAIKKNQLNDSVIIETFDYFVVHTYTPGPVF